MHFKPQPLFIFCFFVLSCSSSKEANRGPATLAANSLQPFGRFILNDKKELELISSAVHFEFSFEGTQCQLYASTTDPNGHNYLQYELDGVYQKRLRIPGNAKQPVIITAPAGGKHTVSIYKATEAHTGPVIIQKITGKNLKALPNPSAPLIEFIGNSITCGAASDASEVPCGTGQYHDQHNAYFAYGPRVARALQTNFMLSSVSGIGIYRNWNSDGPTMPQVYENSDFGQNNSRLWNFAAYDPQIVSIALGTNDFSGGDGKKARSPFDSTAFVNNYIQFVRLVRSKYPGAQIALLSSPMINGNNRELLQNCLSAVKAKIDSSYPGPKKVVLHFFKPMEPKGCSYHPSVEDHAILASELIPFFKSLLQ